MANPVRWEVQGLRDLDKRLQRLSAKAAGSAARGATGKAAGLVKKAVVAKIIANPSVDTGSLRDSVIVKKVPKGQTNVASEHMVTFRGRGKPYNKKGQKINRAPHAHLVEFGTVNMPAEPSLRPGFDNNIDAAIKVMAQTLEKRLIKEGV